MGEVLPSSIQAIVANHINNSDNSLRLIDRIKADHEEQRWKLKDRITLRRIYREPTPPLNKPATREWQNNGKSPQRKTEVVKSTPTLANRFSTLEIEEAEEEPEEEDKHPLTTKAPAPFTYETKDAEDFLQQNHEYQQAIGVTSPIVKTALALKFVRDDELENWKASLEWWINALDIETDDVPLVWDLFAKELKGQAQCNKDSMARRQLANLRMKEGQLKAYIDKFEKLAEQLGLTQANPMTTQAFITGLTTPLQDRVNLQPIYGYRVARARAIQEDQEQHAVAKALRARQQQRERLISLLQKRHEPTQEEESPPRTPTISVEHPVTIDRFNQPRNEQTVISNKPLIERQHPVTEALRTKRRRPTSTEYSSPPEDRSTTIYSNEPSTKKQRTTDKPPIEEQPAEGQEESNIVPAEEPQGMKRPIAADYFNQEDKPTLTRTDEPSTKKQRLASIRIHEPVDTDHIRSSNTDVYISARKSMTVRTYVHSKSKRTEALALLDSGATENFLELKYAEWLQLPIKRLPEPRLLFNVDGTENKMGSLQFYTDLKVQTGTQHTVMRFFLTELGTNKMILGYPWFAAVQPNIDWKRGWIDHTQLPIVLRAPDAAKAIFTPRTKNVPRPIHHDQYYIGRVTIHPGKMQEETVEEMFPNRRKATTPIEPIKGIPAEYQRHSKVFSEEASQRLPQHTIWDHAIELLDGAPTTLPGRLLPLTQEERQEAHNFVAEHLKRGTIQLSNSLYAANFFFVKKKDKKLRPVQDYRPVNKWTLKDRNVSPLIPEVIDRLSGCTLFTKFDVRWGYNNIRIQEGDEWKAAFLTPEGLFEPTVMFFGLTNLPATFQMMMNTIFRREVALGWLSVYMDDIAIHTKPRPGETEEEHHARHQEYVHLVLDRLEANNLYLKPEKCAFEQKEIDYLGVIVGGNTLKMGPKKIEGVASWKEPTTVTEVRKFLGFTGYYRYFVPNYSKIARPLLNLMKKSTPWHWEERQQ
jgi:hypothetical protein